jgi:hypothetical protein
MPGRGRQIGRDSRSRSPSKGGKAAKKERQKERDRKKADGKKSTNSPDTDSSSEGAGGTDSSRQLAIPAGDQVLSVDFVSSLATNISELMVSVKDLHIGMKEMQKEAREQRGHISDILGELQSMRTSISTNNQQHKNDMENLNKEIEAKLASLRASTAKTMPPASASASSASAGPLGPPAASPTASAAGSAPGGGHRPTRIWIKGFKEVLTTKYLNDYAQKAIAKLPAELQAGAKTGAPGFGSAVYIDYPTTTRVAPIRTALQEMNLKHTDESGNEHMLRIHPDIPLAVRHKGRVLGELWKTVEPHLTNLEPAFRPKNFKLGNSNGKLFLILDHRPMELFATHVDGQGTLHVTPHVDNIKKYKIDEAMAQAWVASACRSASRGGQ